MLIQDLENVIKEENLKGANICNSTSLQPHEVVITQEEGKWKVFNTDERARVYGVVCCFDSESEACEDFIKKLRLRKRELELRKKIREKRNNSVSSNSLEKNNQSFFWCSLCHNGLLGGELIVDKSTITYKTGKVTVSEKYRNLELRRSCIVDLSWRWIVFPIATFEMNNMEKYSFLIFNKRRFMKVFNNN